MRQKCFVNKLIENPWDVPSFPASCARKEGFFQNYFSIGMDANVALGVRFSELHTPLLRLKVGWFHTDGTFSLRIPFPPPTTVHPHTSNMDLDESGRPW